MDYSSAQAIGTLPDKFSEVVGQLLERPRDTMQLAQQIIEEVAVGKLSQDLLVLIPHPIDVVGVCFKVIQVFR
jgi:hypothetical protein